MQITPANIRENSMAEQEKAKPTPEEREIHRRLAKAIWIVQQGSDLPKDSALRKEAWSEAKNEMIGQARRISHQLDRAGISLSRIAETEAS